MADQFRAVVLVLVVHQLAVDVGVLDQTPWCRRRRAGSGSFRPSKGETCQRGLAVVGLYLGHALDDEFLAHFVGPLIFLQHRGAKAILVDLGGHPHGLDGLEFFQAAASLNILSDDFVDGLRARKRQKYAE